MELKLDFNYILKGRIILDKRRVGMNFYVRANIMACAYTHS